MPKIEVYRDTLFSYVGQKFSDDALEDLLPCAKAELDESLPEENLFKIELNDTNRPDLWSTAGLGRQLRIYLGGKIPSYKFFSTPGKWQDNKGRTVEVDASIKDVRPYIAAFVVKGKAIDDPSLKDLIQTQEKLCWNYGRKRKSIAMGVYRSDLVKFPVKYRGADPKTTKFQPLAMDEVLNLDEIIEKHPKGQDFGHIVQGEKVYPFLEDSNGDVLSFPPVINSARLGAVEVGDKELFVELTGTDLPSLHLACSIVACDLADAGYEIEPVKIVYPYDTPMGREITTPVYYQEEAASSVTDINRLLGENYSTDEVQAALNRMGCEVKIDGDKVTLTPPQYRNDFLHSVDVVEDVMIGRGMNSFAPEMPRDFTVGRITEAEERNRSVKDIMVGLGFQEMIFNYLGSGKDYIEKMQFPREKVIQVVNPMSENYEFVRPSIIPSLLAAEAQSANAVYPHHVYEAGKIALVDDAANYGSSTINSVGFMSADADAGFNLVNSQVSALLFYLNLEYELREAKDERFIIGRQAEIVIDGKVVGIFGEVHPQVLENFGIGMPCTAGEIDLDTAFGDVEIRKEKKKIRLF